MAAYREANPEKVRAANAKYRAANRDKIKAIDAKYYASNRERIKARDASFYDANRERINARNRAYRVAKKTFFATLLAQGDSISMPKEHGIALAPLKGAKLSFIEGKLES